MEIVFTGEQERSAPLTWGQRHVLRNGAGAPQVRIVPVPEVPLERAAAAVAALASRHEALRTRLTGTDEQGVHATGQLRVEVVRGEPGEAAVAQARERLAGPFDHGVEWPLRVALVAADDTVRQVVLACSPLAVDHEGMELVAKDLGLLMRGALALRSAPQPADDARQQHSELGKRLTDRAIRYWSAELRSHESVPAREPGERYSATLRSVAMDTAAYAIADRNGVSASTVYLAATAGLVGALTRTRAADLRTVVSNRFYPDRRDVVATVAQEGVLVLDLAVPSFGELVQQTWRATVRSHRFARYDPDRLAESLPSLPFACFDDSGLVRHDVPALPAEQVLRAAAERTPLTWAHAPGRDVFAVLVDDAGVTVRADPGLVAKADLAGWLHALERLLISAAYRDVATGELTAMLAGPG